jgi:hypothetical protein
MMIRTIRRTVPSPMYMRASLLSVALIVPSPGSRKPCGHGKKHRPCGVLSAMSSRFVLRLGLAALVLVALLGAVSQLAVGRRPVLLGGPV